MSNNRLMRIQRELKQVQKIEKDDVVYIFGDENNNNKWSGFLLGPEDTGYSEGIFEVEVVFPYEYPIEAPQMKFKTVVFHPNIH